MNNPPLTGFNCEDYRSLLASLAGLGYAPCRLEDLRPAERDLYLRHDVDMSLELAVRMARLEAQMGMFSTYFVLVSTTLYNPASAASRRLMAEIIDCGHEIGLHFDATQADGDDLDAAADRECQVLEALTGRAVESISFHRPAREFLGSSRRLAGRRHTYEPPFFSEIGYVSDSNGGWHHGHPLEHEAVRSGGAIQLLTHPIWWMGEGERDTVPLIRSFVAERQQALDDAVAGTITAYAQWRAQGGGA
jgi:hypothetical protein